MITGGQVKAARQLLGWSQVRLAGHSNLAESSISRFEIGGHLPPIKVAAIRQALETAGVEFIEDNDGGASVRLRTGA